MKVTKIKKFVNAPVFVISFPERRRRSEISKRLASLGIEARFFDAVPGSSLKDEQKRPFLESGRELWSDGPLRDGAMGCSLAHFGVWRTILDEGHDAAVVLEDDAIAIPSSSGIILDRLNKLYERRDQLDLVFLHRRWNRPSVRVDGTGSGEPGLVVPRYSDLGAISYFMTARCARQLLSRPDRYRFEVDKIMHHWWRMHPNIHVLIHEPSLFSEGGRASKIGYDHEPQYDTISLVDRSIRRWNRLNDSLSKRLRFRRHVARIQNRLA